jgi:hypothetical protein
MKGILIDLVLLIIVILACYLWGFITNKPPHEVAVWGLLGYLIASRRSES